MKTATIPAILALLATGCGGAPDPLPTSHFDGRDRRYSPPAERGDPSPASALLCKEELTLPELIRLADALHPELAAERKAIDEAAAAIWDAKLYPNPTLLGRVEDYPLEAGGSFSDAKRVAGLGVPVVVSGRIGAATTKAERERDAAALRYVWRRREILGGVQKAFVVLLAARRSATLAGETRDLAQRFHAVTDARFRAQAVPEMELLKAAVNLAKSDLDLKLAVQAEQAALQGLRVAVGSFDLPTARVAGELATRFVAPSVEALRGQLLASHPLLEAARARKEAAEAERDLAKSARIPDPTLEILGGRDGGDSTILEAGLSIPLPLFDRAQGRIAGAEARIRKAEFEADAVRNELLRGLADALRTLAAAQDRVAVFEEEILPKAGRAAAQTDEGYRLGKHSLLDVLDAQRTLAEARLASSAALADLNLAAAELEKLSGTRLDAGR